MAATIRTAHAPIVTFVTAPGGGRGAYHAVCPSGRYVGYVQVIRGFAHYTGYAGNAHEGVFAVVRADSAGDLEGLRTALAGGLRNGRRDDLAND